MADKLDIDVTAATAIVVKQAKKEDRLEYNSLTPRMIRREVEKIMKLQKEVLDAKSYRDAVKKVVADVMAEDDRVADQAKSLSEKKRKSDEANEAAKTAKKPKPRGIKKPSSMASPAKELKEATTSSKRGKAYKSVDTIDTSDEGEEPSVSKAKQTKPISSKRGNEPKSAVTIETSDEDEEHPVSKAKKLKSLDKEPPKKRLKVDSAAQKPPSSKPARSRGAQADAGPSTSKTKDGPASEASEEERGGGDKSDSDMSVLIDATPVKRKAKGDKAAPKPKKASEPAKGKKPAKAGKSTLSKDEEAVKRLKSYVTACGVRKVWSKEFQDLDRPSQQIKRLKELLDELGMDGRPTLEKAKAIKEKREIAQELKDVQSFEQSISRQSGRTRSMANNASESGGESESSDRAAPTKKRNAARQSIMAFLGDESEGE